MRSTVINGRMACQPSLGMTSLAVVRESGLSIHRYRVKAVLASEMWIAVDGVDSCFQAISRHVGEKYRSLEEQVVGL